MFFNNYYQSELITLRQFGKRFAEHGPARQSGCSPDVEHLQEGFALLTGRLRQKLPAELQNIADKLMAYAQGGRYGLDEEDERLLWSRYIHLSAHWTPSRGLLISKPAPNVRLTYNNKPQQGYPE
ncbi:Rhs element Vgr protein [Pseudomonas sp. BAY1663]|uniref:type VI secretion system baseplate subunit TssF n=1 Tax=Pseudomonas sp. BAY1663 TaxID=1439940 RepID=UPI00042E1268|nr:Rhs element Vgr protein [Pseudomonas sp. BAY1663]